MYPQNIRTNNNRTVSNTRPNYLPDDLRVKIILKLPQNYYAPHPVNTLNRPESLM